jgi:membrane-associated PAP2 superfamily phosphatase
LKNTVACEGHFPCLGGVLAHALRGVWGLAIAPVRYLLKTPPLWIPLVLLAVITLFFRLTDADLTLAQLFFNDAGSGSRWPLGDAEPWRWLYDYGIYPAWILGGGGLAVWLLSFFWKKMQPFRKEGLFFALMLLIGPGILVNCTKPFCGRPRPHLTERFGGKMDFLPVLATGENLKGDCNSFPSGHASTGFYLMAPAFVLYRRRPGWAAAFLLLGLAAGITIGIARMAAGAHFASDVIWAGGFVYFTGLILAGIFRFDAHGAKQKNSFPRSGVGTQFPDAPASEKC